MIRISNLPLRKFHQNLSTTLCAPHYIDPTKRQTYEGTNITSKVKVRCLQFMQCTLCKLELFAFGLHLRYTEIILLLMLHIYVCCLYFAVCLNHQLLPAYADGTELSGSSG